MQLSKREKTLIRWVIGLIYVVWSFILPWPGFLLFTFAVFMGYRILPEAFVVAFAFDILYGAPSATFFGFRFAMTLGVFVIYLLVSALRRRMTARRY